MQKVLIITYYWPPSGGAGVQRWLKFAKYLPEFGWEPHIYTPENPEAPALDLSLEKDIPKEAVIIKRKIFEPYSLYKKFTGKKGNVNAGFLSEEKDSRKKISETISVWLRGNFFIPDARVLWVKPSIKFLAHYIKENDIKVVVSTGPPHSMHLIADALKKKLDIKWIADFRDPWTNIDFYKDLMLTKLADKKHHRLEKEILKNADEVITIGKTIGLELENISRREVKIITNGFDEDDFINQNSMKESGFTIVHVGSINSDRNHDIFWKGLKELCAENMAFEKDLRIIFVGKLDYSVYDDIEKYQLTHKIEIIKYIPHNQIIRHLFAANLLYLPLNNTPNSKGVLSGKFFEYLACNVPIIGIGNIHGDASEIMKETGAGKILDFEDLQGFKIAVLKFYEDKNISEIVDSSKRKHYSRRELTKQLIKLF